MQVIIVYEQFLIICVAKDESVFLFDREEFKFAFEFLFDFATFNFLLFFFTCLLLFSKRRRKVGEKWDTRRWGELLLVEVHVLKSIYLSVVVLGRMVHSVTLIIGDKGGLDNVNRLLDVNYLRWLVDSRRSPVWVRSELERLVPSKIRHGSSRIVVESASI
jgi:hypothetical protein